MHTFTVRILHLERKQLIICRKYLLSNYPKWVINQLLNEAQEKHKPSVNNVSQESQVSPVADL